MKNKAAKQKSKRKGNESAFGCDLTEHLENSGQDVPQVLKTCAEFIETHGIVDGIYRLSGITSNIQRLRQEYSSELSPELTREVYLQDIHCVGSLCKLYFRELPNPLLTFELYNKFMDAVSVKEEHEQLQHIQTLIQELPPSHYRTLEYLTKHLAHMATLSDQTNMHVRNLALVWAPNLLRSKEIDLPNCNGDTAFLEVRVQQAVVEFILNHVEEIFNHKVGSSVPKQGLSLACQTKCATLPASSQCPPMKLMSLEEAQARSMDQKYPAHKSRQRENSLPDTTTAAFYHTVIDLPDNKGSFSGKSKKWKSIFNLGRFVTETKGKQSRNGSVFVKTRKVSEKAPIRPTKSMDSLCSVSMEDNDSEFRQSSGGNDFFKPAFKSSTLESTYNLGEKDHECKPETLRGATAVSPKISGAARKCGTPPLQKAMPEQMKVFKGDNSNVQPNSPKNRRMLYTSSTSSSSSKLAFPGSFFPLESSPRYTPKAISISEPFAVSVPLRVSAVISSNSTPCRAQDKDEVSLLPCLPSREAALAQQGCGRRTSLCGDGNYLSLGKEDWQTTTKSSSVSTSTVPGGHDTEQKETHGMLSHYTKQEVTEPPGSLHTLFHASSQPASSAMFKDTKTGQETMTQVQVSSPTAAESVKQQTKLENQLQQHYSLEKLTQLDKEIIDQEEELWSTVSIDLKIVESDIVEDEFELDHLLTNNTGNYAPIKPYTHGKRRSSFPTYPLLNMEDVALATKSPMETQHSENVHHFPLRDIPKRGLSLDTSLNTSQKASVKLDSENKDYTQLSAVTGTELHLPPLDQSLMTEKEPSVSLKVQHMSPNQRESALNNVENRKVNPVQTDEVSDSIPEGVKETEIGEHYMQETTGVVSCGEQDDVRIDLMREIGSRPKVMEESPKSVERQEKNDENTWDNSSEDLEQVEPWEDCSTTKQWVTSPLHSPKTFAFFLKPELTSCSVDENNKDKVLVDGFQPNMRTESPLEKSSLPCLNLKGKNTENLQTAENKNAETSDKTSCKPPGGDITLKQKSNPSSLRLHKQKYQETFDFESVKENVPKKIQRPYSLNLDLGIPYVIETSGQHFSTDPSSAKRGSTASSETKYACSSSELEMFLNDRRATMRRNSAPVSVSSIRTSFIIKTCQAKAVPVIPPKIQYSYVPQPPQTKNPEPSQEKDQGKVLKSSGMDDPELLKASNSVACPKEEIQNNKPASKTPRHIETSSSLMLYKASPPTDKPGLGRQYNSNGKASSESFRYDRSTVTQRHSFRTRPKRPQSLILFSPPFPIMDYPPLGDDSKLPLSPIKNCNETVTSQNTFKEEVKDNVKNQDSVRPKNKMAIPKIGQRLETSMSCFYQPQRTSMIFERTNRQMD